MTITQYFLYCLMRLRIVIKQISRKKNIKLIFAKILEELGSNPKKSVHHRILYSRTYKVKVNAK